MAAYLMRVQEGEITRVAIVHPSDNTAIFHVSYYFKGKQRSVDIDTTKQYARMFMK
jgi:hypothetical protein